MSPEVARPPLALTVALAIVAVESAVQAGFVIGRDDYGPGGKALLVLAIGAKVLFAAMARRLSAGGALGLLAFELVGILVALGAAWSMGLRLALVACVVAVYTLVLSSLHAFPTPEPPMTAPQAPFRYPMRTKIVIVAVLAVAFTGFALAVMTADTDGEDEVTLSGGPGQSTDSGGVVARSPRDGAQALSQQPFSIRLEPGWTGELTFQPGNGTAVRLPADEIDVTALNELIYQPAEGKTLERLPEGTTSCVLATIWDQVRGREATEKVDQWCFAVT